MGSAAIHCQPCSSRVDQCDAIENGYSTRLEGDAFDAPRGATGRNTQWPEPRFNRRRVCVRTVRRRSVHRCQSLRRFVGRQIVPGRSLGPARSRERSRGRPIRRPAASCDSSGPLRWSNTCPISAWSNTCPTSSAGAPRGALVLEAGKPPLCGVSPGLGGEAGMGVACNEHVFKDSSAPNPKERRASFCETSALSSHQGRQRLRSRPSPVSTPAARLLPATQPAQRLRRRYYRRNEHVLAYSCCRDSP